MFRAAGSEASQLRQHRRKQSPGFKCTAAGRIENHKQQSMLMGVQQLGDTNRVDCEFGLLYTNKLPRLKHISPDKSKAC